ncbi:MAG TPA: fluoride efflux transporter CrcB [Pyrinomonadaceae bacterium]|nr:fluoride efflux transporter CrcB [Pyrinomonadaceae bacterium]HMP66484.1 fluoride efflux transporter CrcB [Pyrinomonadaceae bacterium]
MPQPKGSRAMDAAVKLFSIALGGALGAVARHLVNISPVAGVFEKFPLPTFLINISGSFLLGFFLIMFADKIEVNEHVRLAVIVGFLGAFTTYSTFEMELYGLLRERQFLPMAIYLFLSIFIGFVGLLSGIWLARRFF